MLGATHGVRGIEGEHTAGHQPVEAHANGGEVLLDGGLGHLGLQHFHISGDVERLDVDELTIL